MTHLLKKAAIFFGSLALSVPALLMASCGSSATDYVAETHLTTEYSGKDFISQGIGQVTLKTGIDGDTSHFYAADGTTIIKARYNGIDTPESTGQIQPWGKAASHFTTGKLEAAKTIVLEAENPGSAATKDSTGTRYLSFVWISEKENAPIAELKLLNLWIVQEGYSSSKGISGSKYQKAFTAADLQAQKEKIHIWSDAADPDFNYSDPVECDLQLINEKKIMETGATSYTDYDWSENKVTIKGIVSHVRGTDCWIEATFNNTLTSGKDKVYGMFIFTMYKSYVPLLHTGNEVQCTGTITSYAGNYQMVDVYWSLTSTAADNIQLLSSGNAIPSVKVTSSQISKNSTSGNDYLNVVVTLTDSVYGTGCKVTTTSGGFTIGVYLTDLATSTSNCYLYIEDTTYLKDASGNRLTTKEEVSAYLCNKSKPFKVTAPISKFTSDDESYTNYDLCYCGSNDIVFDA
jgi:endonuclease YncB( thermonuclease family)